MLLKTVAVEIFKGRNNKGGQGSTQYPYANYRIVSFFLIWKLSKIPRVVAIFQFFT